MSFSAQKLLSQMDFSAIKNRQRYLLWGVGSFLMGGMVVYGWVSMRESPLSHKQEFKSALLTGSSRINAQEAWVYQVKTDAEIAKKRMDVLEDRLSKLFKLHKDSQSSSIESPTVPKNLHHQNLHSQEASLTSLVGELRDDLKTESQTGAPGTGSPRTDLSGTGSPGTGLPGRVETLQIETFRPSQSPSHVKDTPKNDAHSFLPPPPGSAALGSAPGSTALESATLGSATLVSAVSASPPDQANLYKASPFRSKAVRKISLSLRNARSAMPLKTVDNTIPAGAFAKAILLGGVDASAAIQASSDPRPALLRLMDAGTLPRRFRSDLKGCHVLAACYGDISSERVFMRLEKLTCTERKTGEVVEVKVQGYVAGEDGRTGVRGSVVDRAGESMRNVLMGGFLGGIGEFLSQSHNAAVTFSPMAGGMGGLTQNPMGMKDMVKHGAGKGLNNALDKYADFYIKRAEQLQPVIQVAAGRQVDIVFTEGLSMGDSVYRQALGRSHDQERYQQLQAVRERPEHLLTDWQPTHPKQMMN